MIELCRRRQLPTAGNRARLYEALGSYTPDEIRGAVTRLCDDLRRGTAIRSPLGLLLHKAVEHDTIYFTPLIAPTCTTPRAAPGDGADELARLAELALDEMDAEPARWATQLAELDAAVDAYIAAQTPTSAEQIRRIAPLRRGVRLDLYRNRLTTQERQP